MFDRRHFIQGAGSLLLGAALPPFARSATPPPAKRLVFGLASGAVGSRLAEVTLALLARQQALDYRLEVIEGRNTQQASEAVKQAPPDGSTLLQTQSSSMVLFPSMYRRLGYDPLTDFTPLAMLGEYTMTLSVGPAVPASVVSLDGYLKWVSSNPDYRDVGFLLYGSQGHLISLMMARSKEIALRPQPYKSPRSLIADLNNGSLAGAILLSGATAAAGGGSIRNLAISSAERLPALPDLPTFKEQGVGEAQVTGWYGWFGPASMPAALAQSVRDRVQAVQATPEYAQVLRTLLMTPLALSPAQMLARIREEIVDYHQLVERYGLSPIT
jgi:tripartite-type tricarboxylate transporter receptor subunit TctC